MGEEHKRWADHSSFAIIDNLEYICIDSTQNSDDQCGLCIRAELALNPAPSLIKWPWTKYFITGLQFPLYRMKTKIVIT